MQRGDDIEQFADLIIYVSHCGINLIGRDGQVKLHIQANLYLLPITRYLGTRCLQEVNEISGELFKPQLRCCNSFKVTLLLREGAKPKYCKVRKLPFALKPIVGTELDRLEK